MWTRYFPTTFLNPMGVTTLRWKALVQPSSFSSSQINFGAGGNAIALIHTLQRNAIQGIGSCHVGEIRSRVSRGWAGEENIKKNGEHQEAFDFSWGSFFCWGSQALWGWGHPNIIELPACQINLSQYLALQNNSPVTSSKPLSSLR